jgi:hypothetical protein
MMTMLQAHMLFKQFDELITMLLSGTVKFTARMKEADNRIGRQQYDCNLQISLLRTIRWSRRKHWRAAPVRAGLGKYR